MNQEAGGKSEFSNSGFEEVVPLFLFFAGGGSLLLVFGGVGPVLFQRVFPSFCRRGGFPLNCNRHTCTARIPCPLGKSEAEKAFP